MEKTPDGGWTAEDLDRIPGLPSRTQLLDGELVFRAPQTVFHMRAMRLLENRLLHAAPPELEVVREMTVTLGKRDRPEPGVLVARADADTGPRQTGYRPEDVVLAVEVVSDDSEARDRETKPRKYAAAGIPHFWRVEAGKDGWSPVVYVFELEPATRTYAVTGIHHERLKTDVPFPVDIDLTAVARRV
ncbi:Uma2 family endonuclease [Streptomyces radiopugnans]|nr:Uma2 family endonuclease [Streptomyces radiopugnans]